MTIIAPALSTLAQLPAEILRHILDYPPNRDIKGLGLVEARLQGAVRNRTAAVDVCVLVSESSQYRDLSSNCRTRGNP